MRIEEKRKSFSKNINIKTLFDSRLHIGFAVSERKSDFLDRGTSRFPDMVSRDRNGIPFWQFLSTPLKNIRNDAHGRPGWINIGSPGSIFFQNIILNRTRNF